MSEIHSIIVNKLQFKYQLEEIRQNSWRGTVISIADLRWGTKNPQPFSVDEASPDSVRRVLEKKIKQQFTIQIERMLNPWQAVAAVVKWIWSAQNFMTRARRILITALLLFITSVFFIDYRTSDVPFKNNVQWVLGGSSIEVKSEGFFNEVFFQNALNKANHRFWASGVSFRTLVTGNSDELAALLERDVEFKLVLLDPVSPLAAPNFIQKISRTATTKDIRETSQRLVGEGGILTTKGNASRHELWLSDYAPIVPMVIVDNEIYVSFLRHVDRDRMKSAYDTTYLRIATDSDTGKSLEEHFKNMLDHAAPSRF